MAQGRKTLYEVPEKLRAMGAARARKTLREMLNMPGLTAYQIHQIQDRLAWVDRWSRCEVDHIVPKDGSTPPSTPKALPPAPVEKALPPPNALRALTAGTRTPRNHDVTVEETVTVTENQK